MTASLVEPDNIIVFLAKHETTVNSTDVIGTNLFSVQPWSSFPTVILTTCARFTSAFGSGGRSSRSRICRPNASIDRVEVLRSGEVDLQINRVAGAAYKTAPHGSFEPTCPIDGDVL
jgi:hypothetical protein